jgi:hypothetical protein
MEAADASPDDSKRAPYEWLAELAWDDCSVAAARARGSAQVDSASRVDDRRARLSQAYYSVALVLVDWAQQPDVHSERVDFLDGSPVG